MSRRQIFRLVELTVEVPEGSIRGDEPLRNFPKWDSLALMEVLAAIEKESGIALPLRSVVSARTLDEIVAAFGERLSD